jgi:F420H(2)-dependent quinone reductase
VPIPGRLVVELASDRPDRGAAQCTIEAAFAPSTMAGDLLDRELLDRDYRWWPARWWPTGYAAHRAWNSRAPNAVAPRVTERAELSATGWVREQTERILEQGTTDGVEILDRPIVLFTTTGAQSGKKRYVPLMRVEQGGRYAMVASNQGNPRHPTWYYNVKAHPSVTVQDGDKVQTLRARELEGAEREEWWTLAVQAYPPYAEYQTKTTRFIPVLVAE